MMFRHLRAAVAALLLFVLGTAAAHATASGAVPCSGGSFNISANWAGFTCPDLNEELTNANNRGIIRLGSVSGTNTITANASPFALTSYQDGQHFTFKPAVQNTSTVTLNINSLGAKAVVKQTGAALASADLLTTTIYTIQYYAADDHFRVMGPVGAVGTDDDVPEAGDFGNLALTGDVTSVGLATTIAANAVALTTDTTGNYVGTVADGTGIDGTASGEGATFTPTLDLTELSTATWGAGSFTAMTFDAGAVDPVLTFGSGTLTMSALAQVNLDDEGEFRLFEEDANGANYVGFKAPAALTSSTTCTLEDDSSPIPQSCVGTGTDDDVPEAGDFGALALSGDVTSSGLVTTIAANSVALTTDTTGNYAAGDAEAGAALTGDSATAFFSAGTIEDARIDGSAEADEVGPGLTSLANLVTIQGRTVTLADAGANAFFGWDDVAGAYENLTAAEAEAIMEPILDTLANVTSIQGQTITYADAGFDTLFGWDDNTSEYKNLLLADISTEAAPAAGDFLYLIGAEGDLRKVDWSSLPGVGGGINNVSEDTSPTLGGNLEGNAFSLGTSGSQAADVFLEEGGVVNWDAGDCTLTQTGNSVAFGGCTLTGASVDAGTDTAAGVLELATNAEAETGTDTARAVTAAGIKAAGTGIKSIALLAGAGTRPSGGAIAACTAVDAFDSGSNDIFLRQCSFSASTDNAIYWTIPAPKSSDETIDLQARVDWTSATTTDGTDNVIWTMACVAFSNDDAINGNAFPTVDTVTDTQTAAGDFLSSSNITTLTPAGTWAEGDMLVCRLTRDADNASDNFNGTAELINVQLFVTTNALTDD